MQFGCNPGLISVLTKKALQDIVREDKGDFVSANRSDLQEMLENSTLQEDPFYATVNVLCRRVSG